MALADDVMRDVLASSEYLEEYAKAMGAFVVRFSGDKLAHVGKAADGALERVLAMAKKPVRFRGFITKGAKRTRYAASRALEGAGRKLLSGALATLKAMPKDATEIYFKDGKPDSLVPDDFAAYLSLAHDARKTFATGKGFLACAFPMTALEDAKWTALVDERVVLLGAEVAWMGPALWLAPHCLFNSSSNDFDEERHAISLWGKHPHVDVPSVYASRAPFDFDEYEPSALAGLLGPAWRMWLAAPLAKKVKTFGGATAKLHGGTTRFEIDASPFAMTEAIYTTWKTRWAELAPVHVTNPSTDEIAPYYTRRFAAKTYAELLPAWKSEHDIAKAKRAREGEISRTLQKLAENPTKKLLEYAEGIAKEMTSSNAWYFLPGLRELLAAGAAKPEEASVWLDLCEQMEDKQILPKAAAVAAAAGEIERAIDLLRRAIAANQVDPKHLVRDPSFKPLRKHAQWPKLTGATASRR
jgi:hypothetical protein